MSIFKGREKSDVQLASGAPAGTAVAEGQAAPRTKVTPPFVPPVATPRAASAPGVVPPPAAPIYSMLPPEPVARVESSAESTVAARMRVARDAQRSARESVHESVEFAVQRRRTDAARAPVARQRPARSPGHTSFDATRAAQTGLLNLAWSWQEAGAPIRAIHTYMQVLERYPDTPAADAAVADLVELSDKLAEQGQFHTALAIYEELEHLT
jgi:hypothetical protein